MSASTNASVIHPFSPCPLWLDTQDLCLDTDYTGHLLIDASHEEAMETEPGVVFDNSTVCNIRPWWNHLLPKADSPDSTVATAQEMLNTYIDPYAAFRRRTVHPTVASLKNEERASVEASSLVTPPVQLCQRFEYDDNLLAMPAATTLPSIHSMFPEGAVDEDMNTPKELIEAAVAALMANSQQKQAVGMKDEGDAAWTSPMSASFVPDRSSITLPPLHSLHHGADHAKGMTGPIRHRSYTVVEPMTSWYRPDDAQSLVSPDPFEIEFTTGDTLSVAESGVHQCRWMGCSQVLPSAAALTLHVNRAHIARRQPAHRCLWQGCNRSDHVFRHRDKILIHVRLHTNDRPFACDAPGCDKHFSRADSLEAHKKVHAAEGRVWRCRMEGCARTYFHAKSLKKHERSAHDLDLDI
jgi:hypothetical protein